jgi:predicted metal-dependent phosphoesterase TrpH
VTLKVELHAHTDADPADRIPHSTEQLIARAGRHGYGAIAVTLHNRWFDPEPYRALAETHGIVLLRGIERTIHGRHVLLIDMPRDAERVRTFDDVRALKGVHGGLVVAPHAFYPIPSALRDRLDALVDVVDALEINSMYVRGIDFNAGARRWATAHGTPLVGNTDLHRLEQLGMTWSEVDAAPEPAAICDAIRTGRVVVRTRPLGWLEAAGLVTRMLASDIGGSARR